MLDELRDRMATALTRHHTCVLSVSGPQSAWAMPVRYQLLTPAGAVPQAPDEPSAPGPGPPVPPSLEIECLLPRWADGIYYLEQNPRVMLIVQDAGAPARRWIQIQGQARPVPHPDWRRWRLPVRHHIPLHNLYQVIRVTPRRIDLVDEKRGWGARETLELAQPSPYSQKR